MAEAIKPCVRCGGTKCELGSSKTGLFTNYWVRCWNKKEDGTYCGACGITKMSAQAAVQAWNKGILV